jgi:hypothetical protein
MVPFVFLGFVPQVLNTMFSTKSTYKMFLPPLAGFVSGNGKPMIHGKPISLVALLPLRRRRCPFPWLTFFCFFF